MASLVARAIQSVLQLLRDLSNIRDKFLSRVWSLSGTGMLISHDREKLINAMVFFASKTLNCGKVKLFKLLYFLDFEHYRQTGRTVTGLEYFAFPMGPVPKKLDKELERMKEDLRRKIEIEKIETKYENPLNLIKPKAGFDDSHFTQREMRIMKGLVKEFYLTKAQEISDLSHLKTQPWHKIYHENNSPFSRIPYDLVLDAKEIERIHSLQKERKDFLDSYK